MPEGDTVWRTARRLHQVFAGRPLTSSDLRWPSLATVDLTGATTLEVLPRGKHLLHRLDSGLTLHSHLRMEGAWRIEPASAPVPRQHQVRAVLGTAEHRAVGWSLGMLDLVPTTEEHTLVGHLGPDILGPDWDAALAAERVAASGLSLASALLDQRCLAGLGTIWTAECLFAAGLDPFAPAASAPVDRLADAFGAVQRRMRASCLGSRTGGGHLGVLHVHGRRRQPCHRCGTPIAMVWHGPPTRERTIYFCPRCQTTTGPAEDQANCS